MGTGELNAGVNPIGGVEILLVVSCYRNQDKVRPDGPLGSYADLTSPHMVLHTYFKLQLITFSKKVRQILGRTFTLSTSPRCTRSTLMTFSLTTVIVPGWSLTSRASEGCNDNSLASASDVFPFATCSIQRPREMNTNNIGGVSKNVIGLWLLFSTMATPTTTIWQRMDWICNEKFNSQKWPKSKFPLHYQRGNQTGVQMEKNFSLSTHASVLQWKKVFT